MAEMSSERILEIAEECREKFTPDWSPDRGGFVVTFAFAAEAGQRALVVRCVRQLGNRTWYDTEHVRMPLQPSEAEVRFAVSVAMREASHRLASD